LNGQEHHAYKDVQLQGARKVTHPSVRKFDKANAATIWYKTKEEELWRKDKEVSRRRTHIRGMMREVTWGACGSTGTPNESAWKAG